MITNSIMREQLLKKFSFESLQQSVWLHTGRTGNIYEMEAEELETLYYIFFPRTPTLYEQINKQHEEQKLKKLRSIILKDAQYIGLYDPQNWTPFNEFMNKLSVLKKPLNRYKADEFGDLIKQFKSLKTKYNQRAKILLTKEWYHKNKLPMPSNN